MNISTSIRKLTYVFISLFLALSGGLIYWQVVEADNVTSTIHNPRSCLSENNPVRGNIYDRNGVLLATSIPSPSSCGGGYIRHYTDPGLANVLGFYAPGYYSPPGVESEYNDILNGSNMGSTALDNQFNKVLHKAPVGNNIYLTIDERVQKSAEKEFNNDNDPTIAEIDTQSTTETFSTDRGSLIVSDPHTGEMLAMVSGPGYDPNKMVQTLAAADQDYFNQIANNPENPMLDRPLNGLYTPGSTFKTVTLMAALESGSTKLDTNWNRQQAVDPLNIDGTPVTGDNLGATPNIHGIKFVFHFPITTEFAFANSDNIVFAQIGMQTGQQTWLDYTKKLFIGQKIPFDLDTATSSVLDHGKPLTRAELASNAYGQGADLVTPLQMSLVDNTVANNGVLMRPMLILKITDHNKNTLQSFSPQSLGRVISQDTAFKVRQAMSAVTTCGSGWHIGNDIDGPASNAIAGKTGTGEVGGDQHPEAWMITQAPFTLKTTSSDQMPAITITAMRENGGEGASAIGPAIWNTYNDIFSNNDVKAQIPTRFPSDPYCRTVNLWQTP
jgi:peptidoglycan glycosyltransferase